MNAQRTADIDDPIKQAKKAGLTTLLAVESGKKLELIIMGLGVWYPVEQFNNVEIWRTTRPCAREFVKRRYCRFAFEISSSSVTWFAFGEVPVQIAWEIFGGKGKTSCKNITLPWPPQREEVHIYPYVGPHDDHGACYCHFEIKGQNALKHFVQTLKKYDLHQVKRQFQDPGLHQSGLYL